MTRDNRTLAERTADALLCAASFWQRGYGSGISEPERVSGLSHERASKVVNAVCFYPAWPEEHVRFPCWASAALSEVCHGLGFDIETVKPAATRRREGR